MTGLFTELEELCESWVNGNRAVRDQVRDDWYRIGHLALMIAERDSKQQAEKFLDGF